MHDAIRAMIEKRRPQGQADWDRALREVLQEAALAGLWRTGFFNGAAFYGGTALRLFHGLDRFSEDLDFTLIEPDPAWRLAERLDSLRAEIEAFGFSVDIDSKHEGKIDSAFIKANTKIHLIRIEAPFAVAGSAASNRLVKVKLETDTDPPAGIKTEMKTLLEPFPVSVRVVTPPCLFAGKLHACLCRSWKTRVKGRDWYDYLFFVARGVPVDVAHLEARLRQSGHWKEGRALGVEDVKRLLLERIAAVDWKQAVEDALPFVRDPRAMGLWGTELFRETAARIVGA
ncbi:MAG: nucleotidyl transferase AbiEii/AbiGii toxin family protein [Spirochaetaceae bacterium]|nr:nucleotidyl transferase AbiEii/AbiGii toxin family protein [Spirochaetaceae bacterium]